MAILKPLLIGIFISAYFLGGVTFAEKQQVKAKEPLIHNNHTHTKTKTENNQAIDTRNITIQTFNMKYKQTEFVLEKNQRVNLILNNEDNIEHDIEVILPNINEIESDHEHSTKANMIHLHANSKEKQSIRFIPTTAGSYEFVCTVPGHKELGMVGKIIVR